MDNYVKGSWNAICDRCGAKKKSGQLKKEWTGYRVCEGCFETRHPQDFVRGKTDDQSVPWTRSEPADQEIDTSGWVTPDSVPTGTFDNEL